jgi:Ca2+-binding RTX toxin-like protein
MRRVTLLLIATIAAMLLATGAVLAQSYTPFICGNDNNNVCKGTTGSDLIQGKGGADALYGRPGDDKLEGGDGNDNYQIIIRYDRNNTPITAGLRGGAGIDTVIGGSGNDDVIGHTGNDTLEDKSPSGISDNDRAFGGPGKDSVDVADGDTIDEVSCGIDSEEDTATIDVGETTSDKVYDCDVVVNGQNGERVDPSSLPHMQLASPEYDPTPPTEPSSAEPA